MCAEPGQYWKCIQGDADDVGADACGKLFLVTRLDDDGRIVVPTSKNSSVHFDPANFYARFEFAPDGLQQRQIEITGLLTDINAANMESEPVRELYDAARALNPQLTDATGATQGSIMVGGTLSNPIEIKDKITAFRSRVMRFELTMKEKQARLQTLLDEQAAMLASRAGALEKMAAEATKMLGTINVYLGKDEEIVPLRGGAPASADELISIRQLVLYMDEECAVAAEDGGIDAMSIAQFDAWLLDDPAHLQQILPETKGVVALKPRRHGKDYGNTVDQLTRHQLDIENKRTYWLLRNGERLFRISTDLQVGDHVVPYADELQKFFVHDKFNYATRTYEEEVIRPGSSDYMNAMKQADETTRHYMTILLFLQGLIDRTQAFRPLPAPRVNILDERFHEHYVRYILDAEPGKLLPTGHVSFIEWRRDINTRLRPGHRIIATFNWNSREDYAVSPARASAPNSLTLHTIEREQDGNYVFLYPRTDTIYRRGSWRGEQSEKRATCRLRKSSPCFLNFDLATVEDMEFYLRSRTDRDSYMYMFPLFHAALTAKKREVQEESPFRLLLIGQIASTHEVSTMDAEHDVDELINWWKFKNRTHRALLQDDTRALRMIVQEYGLRLEKNRQRMSPAYLARSQSIVDAIVRARPHTMYVGHKSGSEYASYAPMNDQDIFVSEVTWRVTRDGVTPIEEKDWRGIDNRNLRWHPLMRMPRWKDFKKMERTDGYLTDPEIQQAVAFSLAHCKDECKRYCERYNHDESIGNVWRSLTVTVSESRKVTLWAQDCPPRSRKHLLTRPINALLNVAMLRMTWRREADGTLKFFCDYGHRCVDSLDDMFPWNGEDRFQHAGPNPEIVWHDTANIAAYVKDQHTMKSLRDETRRQSDIVHAWKRQLSDEMKRNYFAECRAKFMAEYDDETLWQHELHKAHNKYERGVPQLRVLAEVVNRMVERGHEDLTGLTVQDLVVKVSDTPELQNELKYLPKTFTLKEIQADN